MHDLSIIIVNWNARQHLLNCLHSIEECAGELALETIVVDNASTDGSPIAVQADFPRVHLMQPGGNLGFARANNLALREATGRYLALVNSDVLVRPGCFQVLCAYMDAHPDVGLCGPRILNPDGTLQISCRRFPSLWNNLSFSLGLSALFPHSAFFSDWFMRSWPHDSLREVDVLSGCFWLARASAVRKVGLLDERFFMYGEDVDWCRRFHASGWRVMFVPSAEAVHFGGASSANAPLRFHLEMQKADLQYWRKHHGRAAQATYAAILFVRHSLRLLARALAYAVQPSRRELLGGQIRKHWATLFWLVSRRERVNRICRGTGS